MMGMGRSGTGGECGGVRRFENDFEGMREWRGDSIDCQEDKEIARTDV